MIDYATPWSFLLLWKVIWEQQKYHQERRMRHRLGYADFKPRNAGLLSTSAGYNILNFKACLVNQLINIRFFLCS